MIRASLEKFGHARLRAFYQALSGVAFIMRQCELELAGNSASSLFPFFCLIELPKSVKPSGKIDKSPKDKAF
ncbi:MAG: hypothetical protein RR296_00685 [Clostridia bacterium]